MRHIQETMGVKEFEDHILKADRYKVWVRCYAKKKRALDEGIWVSISREEMDEIADSRSAGEKVRARYCRDTKTLWI